MIYDLTAQAMDDEIENFYETLDETVKKLPCRNILFLMADFNTKVVEREGDSKEVKWVG